MKIKIIFNSKKINDFQGIGNQEISSDVNFIIEEKFP
jgi:hypothetical protein